MKKLLELKVRVRQAAGNILWTTDYADKLVIEYFCNKCGTYFRTNRAIRHYSPYVYGYGEECVVCPECGTLHKKGEGLAYSSELVPLDTTLTVYELKEEVRVTLKFSAPKWRDNGAVLGTFREELRYKIKERKTTFKDVKGGTLELGNPLDVRFFDRSYLRAFVYESDAKISFSELTNFLKLVRDTVERKHKEIHGFKLKSTFAHYDKETGRIAFPLFNIAYRLIFTDSTNLDRHSLGLNHRHGTTSYYERVYGFNRVDVGIWSRVDVNAPYQWLRRVYGVFDNPSTRKILANDIFSIKTLAGLQKLEGDTNQLVTLYDIIYKQSHFRKPVQYIGYTNRYINDILNGLNVLRRHYDVASIIRLFSNKGWSYVVDTVRMLKNLPNRYQILSRNVKLKHLHDWCSATSDKIRHMDFELGVPKGQQKSWSMELGELDFYLPKTSYELKNAGQELKNCVGTYDEKCRDGICSIVLVSDDKDKLVACLEIKDSALVQAKLPCNERVATNDYMNEKVLEWCRKAHIKPATMDIKVA